MTSTLLSRPVDISRYGIIYASSGKNLGPAGVCVAIVRDDLIDKCTAHPQTPSVMDYRKMASSQPIANIYNTPPTYLVYMMDLVLQWLQEQGGVQAMEKRAARLASMVYEAVDSSNGFYENKVTGAHRSRMNVPFRIRRGASEQEGAQLEKQFVAEADKAGLLQLCGHPLFGGIRVTLYNNVPEHAVDRVLEFMNNFRAKHA
jgi:phosphoserine aminotransferase